MSFQEPVWLTLTPLLLLVFGGMLAYGFQRRDVLLSRFAASRLLDQLTAQASRMRTGLKAGCILLAVGAIGIALARPQLGIEWSERKARGLDIVFVLDSSKSMLATDLRPTRLDRAKLAIIDLVERLESDRIGLVAFAGQAFLQTPPTLDYSAFRESLDAVDPSIMTSGGSDLGNAIKEAAEAFPSESNVKVVVLLTDGEDLGGHAAEAATAAQAEGIQVFAIGIGTPEGEYLKIRNAQGIEEFVRDAEGQPVRSQLDESTLQQIAQTTGGSYSRLSNASLDQLYRSVIATLPREERESELQEIHIERFQWALSTAVICLVLEVLIRRRRSAAIHSSLAILALLAITPRERQECLTLLQAGPSIPFLQNDEAKSTSPTDAAPADTPQRSDARSLYNSAYQALSEGDYPSAIQGYETAIAQTENFKLQGDALYNLGYANYQQARQTYQSGDPQTALEQIKKAEALYQSAQEIAPEDTSIQQDLAQVSAAREMIEKLIEEQQKQNPEQQDQSEDSEQQGDQSEENQESQQGEQDQSEQGEQDQGEQGEESEDSQQGEQSDSSQQDQSDQQSSDQADSQSGNSSAEDPQSSQDGSQDEASDSQGSPPGAEQESTQDPVDDIPQPGEANEDDAEQESPAGAAPEATEDESNEEGSSAATGATGEAVEGMTAAEAAALLDSLQGKETLLPFIDQSRSGRQGDLRDW
ncbi:VWA domain-containing protein [Coraliomargarita sp. SDUM461003]|uniref:VWA domain-containing protein n=1 Tax=Thalassobacterium maritimum TaxID=3041265 RepID=A0ABU1AQV2_9BACT|nr:VWA domain-containing protein [Coraliomargarita sp. SDUM461003]MDQ8206539.1 VWA domain-containing protein [Coraliomargarita sp. SDUM461003]